MGKQDPQQSELVNSPGGVQDVPQAQPTLVRPDNDMGTMSKALGADGQDYEARYKGLDRWVQREFNPVRQQVEQFGDRLDQIQDLLKQLQQPQPAAPAPQAKAPQEAAPASKPQPSAPSADPIDAALTSMKAQQYRDTLLDMYTRRGEPGEGLPLEMFRDNIPVRPPTVKDDGSLDDSAQRQAIETFIETLKGIRGETQKAAQDALLEGMTPGSAAAPPAPGGAETAAKMYQEFQDLMSVYGSKEFLDLSAEEQAEIEERYYTLAGDEEIQRLHGGQLTPTPSFNDLNDKVTKLAQQVRILQQNKNPLATGI